MAYETKTVKVTKNTHDKIDEFRNGQPRTKFLDQLFQKIDITWIDNYTFKVKGKR